jgi:retron-type reverse transcriptase
MGQRYEDGTPQGGVISPLLANICMNLIGRAAYRQDGVFGQTGVKIVRYADDFVLMGQRIIQQAEDRLDNL